MLVINIVIDRGNSSSDSGGSIISGMCVCGMWLETNKSNTK